MKKVTLKFVASLLLGTPLCVFTPLAFGGEIVYDNSTTKLNQIYAPGGQVEFGDEIKLAGTVNPLLSTFTFEYILNNASGNEFVRLRLYNNNGAPVAGAPTPGSLIYDFGFEHIDPTPLNDGLTLKFAFPPNIVAPSDLTWTVSFLGIAEGETAGLELYNPPTVGNGYDDFWEKNPGTGLWELKTGPVPMSFGARMEAVPEASPIAIGLLAGLLILGVKVYRRNLAKA